MSLEIFVATRLEDVPATCKTYASVDGSVPGAAFTWDHHLSGERLNLHAMPDFIDLSGLQGVATTLPDTDALASVVAVLFGGKGNLRPEVLRILEAASHRCDHLIALPGLDESTERLGYGLHAYVWGKLEVLSKGANPSALFSSLCREVAEAIAANQPLPCDTTALNRQDELAEQLERQGRLKSVGQVGRIDLRGGLHVYPGAAYRRLDARVAVTVDDHRCGGNQYTVGVNPFARTPLTDLRPALTQLAEEEFALGPPALSPAPIPGSENWGGRQTVFGSPWNYGSRLTVDQVIATVASALGLGSSP